MSTSKRIFPGKEIEFHHWNDSRSLTIRPRHIILFVIIAPLSFVLGCTTRLYMISNRMTFVWDRCNQASGTEGMGTKPINLPSLELVSKSFPATTYTSKIFPSAIVATLTCSTVHQATDSELDSNVDQMSSSTSSLDYDSSDDDSSDDEESKIKASNSDESVNKPYGQHLVSVNY